MENHLGRLLNLNEIIHHKNENKKDNRIENLEVLSRREHVSLHSSKGRAMAEIKCPFCKSFVILEKRQTHLSKKNKKYTSCSRKCANLFYRKLSQGLTTEMKKAISENIVREFNSLDNSEETVLHQDP